MVGFVWVHSKTWREGLVQRLVDGLIDNFARKWISDLECPKACSGLEYKSVDLQHGIDHIRETEKHTQNYPASRTSIDYSI